MRYVRLVLIFAFAWVIGGVSAAATDEKQPTTIVIVHGAWGGAWQFSRIEPLLRERGYDVRRITLTGLGERSHLASADIGLATHIEDVTNVIRFENLHDVILLGHSYGGMVITGVADRIPDRIAQVIYLDALLPNDGESAADAMGSKAEKLLALAHDGFIAPWWVKPDKPFPKDVPHPVKTLTDALKLEHPDTTPAGAYILTVDEGKIAADDDFYASSVRAAQRGWPVLTMTGDHNPYWRQPAATVDVILQAIRAKNH